MQIMIPNNNFWAFLCVLERGIQGVRRAVG